LGYEACWACATAANTAMTQTLAVNMILEQTARDIPGPSASALTFQLFANMYTGMASRLNAGSA
jgi:hypothetical protein